MNKLIYAIGVAVASTVALSSRTEKVIPETQLNSKTETIQTQPEHSKSDSTQNTIIIEE